MIRVVAAENLVGLANICFIFHVVKQLDMNLYRKKPEKWVAADF